MTDEKRAEKYFIRFLQKNNVVDILPIKTAWDLRCLLIDVIKYVLEEGKPKWHDLRKTPDDLPKECQNVLCLCNDIGCKYYCTGHLIYKTWFSNTEGKVLRVTAWCELPKFEE